MATLEITEYGLPTAVYGNLVPLGTQGGWQEVAIGAGSLSSAPVGAGVQILIVTPDLDCRVAIGTVPVASNVAPKSRLLRAGGDYEFGVRPGQRVAVIAAA